MPHAKHRPTSISLSFVSLHLFVSFHLSGLFAGSQPRLEGETYSQTTDRLRLQVSLPRPVRDQTIPTRTNYATYGKVYTALNATTGETIAVKQVEIPRTESDGSNIFCRPPIAEKEPTVTCFVTTHMQSSCKERILSGRFIRSCRHPTLTDVL